jgi:hypothetical protein
VAKRLNRQPLGPSANKKISVKKNHPNLVFRRGGLEQQAIAEGNWKCKRNARPPLAVKSTSFGFISSRTKTGKQIQAPRHC